LKSSSDASQAVIAWYSLSLADSAASFSSAIIAKISKALFPRCSGKPLGARLSLDASGELEAYAGDD
jgi:hypothetical protein